MAFNHKSWVHALLTCPFQVCWSSVPNHLPSENWLIELWVQKEGNENTVTRVLGVKASVWRDTGCVCSQHWSEQITLPDAKEQESKLSSGERGQILRNRSRTRCSELLQTRLYTNSSSLFLYCLFLLLLLLSFFPILSLLTQSSMRTFLATLQRNASTSVILIFAPCFIFLYSLTYAIHMRVLSHSFRCFVVPWTVTCQAPLSIEFFRQEYWNG